jgi:hypothetical protein
LAQGDALTAAWALARTVYGDPGLLPPGLDEAHARVLVGEPASPDAPRELRDLAETRAAVHGDDAPSRSLLVGIASSLHVRGVVVVQTDSAKGPVARVFVAGTGAFDTVLYEPDPGAPATWGAVASATTWASTANALHRGFAEVAPSAVPLSVPPPADASRATPSAALASTPPAEGEKSKGGSRPFYTSPWFWGAIGAAAFAGAAFFFATRDSSDPNIALQVQVPK